MQPNNNTYYSSTGSGYTEDQHRNIRQIRLLVAGLVALVLILAGYKFYSSLQFHVVSTDPSLQNFASVATYVDFNFNQPLSSDGVSVSSSPSITTSHSVHGKTLKIGLTPPLVVGNSYTITISVSSTKDKRLVNKPFTFTAQDVDFNSLSKAQQQAILATQTPKKQNSPDNFTYIGANTLLTNGLSEDQLSDLQLALFHYIQQSKQRVSDITFDNITPPAPHPDNPLAPDITKFTVQFDKGPTYNAQVAATDLSTAQISLFDAKTGTQIYKSGQINVQTQRQ